MLLSILIAAIPDRYHLAHGLLYSLLESQAVARRPDVELLYVMDNRRRSVGAKRNALLDMAKGDYVCFIDDDDMVATDYVQKITAAIAVGRKCVPPADVIVFPQRATIDGGVVHECTYSLDYFIQRPPEARRQLAQTPDPNVLQWTGPPAHTMAWRRGLLDGVRFEEKNFGEDTAWVDRACEKAVSELKIEGEPLYYYNFSSRNSATRG